MANSSCSRRGARLPLSARAEKWRFLTGDTIHSSPAVAADETVYFGSYGGRVYALDGNTGIPRWSFQTGAFVLSSPVIASDGTVYIGSFDGKLYAFRGSAPLAQSSWPMFKGNPRHTGVAADSLPVKVEVASERQQHLAPAARAARQGPCGQIA